MVFESDRVTQFVPVPGQCGFVGREFAHQVAQCVGDRVELVPGVVGPLLSVLQQRDQQERDDRGQGV